MPRRLLRFLIFERDLALHFLRDHLLHFRSQRDGAIRRRRSLTGRRGLLRCDARATRA